MCPDIARLDAVTSRRALADAEVSMIEKIDARWSWDAPAQWVSIHLIAVEQESLPAAWP